MSDFLGRLTARHSESTPPAIAPRVASRFETSPPPADRETASPTTPVEASPVTAREPERVVERRHSHVRESIERVVRVGDAEPSVVERIVPIQTRVEQLLKSVDTIVNAPSVIDTRRETVREQQIVATPVVPRAEPPTEPRQTVLGRMAMIPASPEGSEPTVIRVHIGRIDVRATQSPSDRPRPRAKTADAAKPMSLDRYLSSKDRS